MESNKGWESTKAAAAAVSSSSKAVIVFFLLLVVGAIFWTRGIDNSSFPFSRTALYNAIFSSPSQAQLPNPTVLYHLHCPLNLSNTPTCTKFPSNTSPPPIQPPTPPPITHPSTNCPSYFRWIHEDLRPWASTGISRATLERAKPEAAFRLVVVNGKAYLEKYHNVFQTRDVFTLWGILQLLNMYPGRVPDFELMFNCEDLPVVRAKDYEGGKGPPPPLFRYCKEDATVDIVFPDWSFWGWPEINIKPWVTLMKEIEKGNKRIKWKDRDKHAYWKGNPGVAGTRQDLMKCNVNKDRDFNARLYAQDWNKEIQKGFKTSDLASQCTHRFKIYIEGRAWSVSEKYILACDSPTLFVTTRFRDFFTRGLMPGHHYVPIRNGDKCRSIKNAVDWGNTHQDKAQAIGKAGSGFIQEELRIDYVYDYMFHLLSEYSKLLNFKPSVPENAEELCLESMACQAQGKVKAYMIESMVKAPSDTEPCIMPPPFGMNELRDLLERRANATAQVEKWG